MVNPEFLEPEVAEEAPAPVKPSNYSRVMLWAFALKNKPVYAGTASPYKVATRRAKNKVARRSRQRNR